MVLEYWPGQKLFLFLVSCKKIKVKEVTRTVLPYGYSMIYEKASKW